MTTTGRHRKPTVLKLLKGTLRDEYVNPDKPEPEVEIPSCPAQLSPTAKAEWRRIIPELEVLGLIAKINRATLAQYCQLWARWLKAEIKIAEMGEVVEELIEVRRGKMGKPSNKEKADPENNDPGSKVYVKLKKNPWVDIALKSAQECRRFANEFGMTPASLEKAHPFPNSKKKTKKDDNPEGAARFFK